MTTLICDSRENEVIKYLSDYQKVFLEIGDFEIVENNRRLAIFERKTLKDFASSISDGRLFRQAEHLHDYKLKNNCPVFYIIETKKIFMDMSQKIGKFITFSQIDGAKNYLSIIYGFNFIYTKNTEHTASTLETYNRLATKHLEKIGGEISEISENSDKFEEYSKYKLPEKSIEEDVLAAWISVKGISEKMALSLMQFSIKECILNYEEFINKIDEIRYESGRKPPKKNISIVKSYSKDKFIMSILCGIRGIGNKSVKDIYEQIDDDLSKEFFCSININGRKMGEKKAEKIVKILEFNKI